MNIGTIYDLMKDIVEAHVDDIRFYSGLEDEFDPANTDSYPAVLMQPISNNENLDKAQLINSWSLVIEYHELMPQNRTVADVNKQLDNTLRILKEILHRFIVDYGWEAKPYTHNLKTETIDFTVPAPINFTPFVGKTENNTVGWQAQFTILEQPRENICCLNDTF